MPQSYKKVIFSGYCRCGHSYEDHHCCCVMNPEAYKVLGPVIPDECDHYGCNETGGEDENGNSHCFKYVDKDNPDKEIFDSWHGTERSEERDKIADFVVDFEPGHHGKDWRRRLAERIREGNYKLEKNK